jgi:ABC-type Fe3+/spermidine/putrescine transport system ATPase subunit
LDRPGVAGYGRVRVQSCEMVMQVPAEVVPGTELEMMIRPERLTVAQSREVAEGAEPGLRLNGRVSAVMYLGDHLDLQVVVAPNLVMMLSLRNNGQWPPLSIGEAVTLTARGTDCWLLPPTTVN